ncbi:MULTISPECIES: AAA domain-containing protein [Sphingobacterium]|uniref:AAA domain-containing protein n=1 Tax=Sphingobacterium TaxID=28453 RepID=UPI00104CC914|nr:MULTISPECIES: AAA domain-containing protein [Sphingobacterium]MCW2263591.1 superfamily I DNA and/or RNA helicase [Sphingobacterium kitahiroshimense]NJI74433.1 AAA family ATPase [Sphingobacterium sp. B16(2022)]TCR06025.1 putative DNA helicase [Sphingobacterium sp. JUb78]
MNYFDELKTLLNIEQDFDREQYETLLLKSSLNERKLKGVTWFPIQIKGEEMGRGDYLTITLSKTNNQEDEHRFRFGMPVALFSNHDPLVDRAEGLISFVNRDTMKIALRVDELPDWTRRGKLGVDLLFDENSYKEMHEALRKAKELRLDLNEGRLIREIIGEEELKGYKKEINYDNATLNQSQNEAIVHILSENPISIIHGPPGTGKTTTLVKAVQALLKKENKQILIVAPSNTAVDVLTERLDAAGVLVTRIGNPVKISEHLQELALDAQVDQHPANKEVKLLKKKARAYTEMAQKYKRSFGRSEREQRKALFDEARKIGKEIGDIQDFMVADILDKAQVVTATLVGSNQYAVRNRVYQVVIIDEAAQALEPACWIPILKANKVVLAGDHCQLPPTVKSNAQMNIGLYHTLFEKLVKRYPEHVSLLNVQYRMNEKIMQYPSTALYDDHLIAGDHVQHWTLKEDSEPVVFIDTAGAGFEEEQDGTATFNVGEARFVINHLKQSLVSFEQVYDESDFPAIAVITPYRRQATVLNELLVNDEQIVPFRHHIQINTIDSFQGQEKDIIYISLTRSNDQQAIGFLSDVRRMNVAMTRAKKKLIVVGDSATVGKHEFYDNFIKYVDTMQSYHSVWEWDLGE